MTLLENLQLLLRPLRTRLNTVVARAVVSAVDDSKKFQQLQLDILDGESRTDVEHFQSFGFRAHAPVGSEVVVVCPGGRRDHAIAIAVNSRDHKFGDLESGESMVYDKSGSRILLKSNGDIEVTPSSGKIVFTGDLAVSGKLDVDGDITSGATITGDEVSDGGKILGTHTHQVTGIATAGSAAAQTQTSPVNTGAPN